MIDIMARLDDRQTFPSGMEEYLSYYGWHFSKKMQEWAASRMYTEKNGIPSKITPYTKDKVDDMLRQYGITLKNDFGYDATYVANMCKADFFNKSIKTEGNLVQYIQDVLDDPDGYEGLVFTRFYADCIGSGTPIDWEEMI